VTREVLIVTATATEAEAFTNSGFAPGTINIKVLNTGVGTMATALGLMRYLAGNEPPCLALNAGIAGSFRKEIPVGTTGIVARDCFADFGIDNRGKFLTAVEARLVEPGTPPYNSTGWIECNNEYTRRLAGRFHFLTGITSDTVSGSETRIKMLMDSYNPDVETMEGASFFYICALEKIPFMAVRAVSNMIEERDHSNWDIPLALRSLSERTREILTLLFTME